jgi:hypothetical protein
MKAPGGLRAGADTGRPSGINVGQPVMETTPLTGCPTPDWAAQPTWLNARPGLA